jgi:hypothetical protein
MKDERTWWVLAYSINSKNQNHLNDIYQGLFALP